ncbi:hypothetical protein GCM10023187_32720 [Nibrella viscosa]|uniref:Uncharacterized protein n=1 Tax=Nibrella viscosa TaxID=1084524 RepID=A0ABP8KKS7_9BACT
MKRMFNLPPARLLRANQSPQETLTNRPVSGHGFANAEARLLFRRLALSLAGVIASLVIGSAYAQQVNAGSEMAALTAGAIVQEPSTDLPLRPAGLYVNTFSSKDGSCLYLIFSNPDRERLTIKLMNEKNQTLFDQFTNSREHGYRFRLEGLPAGNYKVLVQGQTKKITRDIAFRIQPISYQVTMNQSVTEDAVAVRPKKQNAPGSEH